ncbi:rpoE protein [Latilactobacillus sakei subsp. sakei DSM 20017 = JCM 1157]|uniref:Probable DNA-directed RNA polymerase subunit delta n=1 Tax=Latilactobacillus sakei TaxID=1599 RepID=A0AAF0K3X1_LATSK|nr:DNA-directed RNA polymerase subunit delta [Latilactobacillus sakei]KRK70683.1 rpoE protein [Latilactobacillus sakei subsp. sakei DSM 20017 = JCM 1157]MCP8851920.1 DNA-directed RNA polymerase subunit delta [Latilactobacillus sakei]MCP8853075.1 DNA-directed RNA polymerase subunit delta [Latilactobacillus sakei]MDB1553549.1 DNA-directed RNA polymerase subunit delta [Latilactobacillus sakei]MDG9751168.1 DNA-directed RNA polymerase subunit delta [Latilactobacillus sakei]
MYWLKLDVFKGQNKEELSMIEVAHAILEGKGDTIAFADLTNEVQNYLGKSDEEVRARLSQFYTDLNEDGSFISLGENVWGLRSWYPYESVDEEVNHPEDEEDQPTKKKRRKKVNAFLADVADDDDVIDYSDDDPEDEDLDVEDEAELAVTDDDSSDDLTEYKADLQSIGDDDDDEDDDALEDGIEGQLSEFSEDDDEDEEDEDDDL